MATLAVLACGGRRAAPKEGVTPDQTTGAVTALSPTAESGAKTVEELLEGRVPGLEVLHQPNGDLELRIRGTNSLLEGGPPLLVIDGMSVTPQNVGAALRALRPADVRDIQVLKDASSTSVYGSAGAHGVILITTRRE